MSESPKYQSFTTADIERYYKGQMPAQERHALEKAALDDPFLADALEGYAFTSSPVADIKTLQSRLEDEVQKKKLIPLFTKKYNWLQIAALFLLLAGAGWFVFSNNFFSKKEIAVAAPAKETQADAALKSQTSDSLKIANPPLMQNQQVEDEQSSRIASKPVDDSKNERTDVSSANRKITESTETGSAPSKNDVAVAPQTNNGVVQQTTLNSRNAYSNNAPSSAKSKDAAGDKNESNTSDSATARATFEGRTAGIKTQGDTIKNMNVAMQSSRESFDEVIVVGKGVQKKAAQPTPKFQPLEPAEGWDSFNEYIAQNLQEPQEIKEKKISGEVQLSFDINKEGEATNIKVEKPLCTTCDAEAIRLVKEGPKWKKKKDKKGKIAIRF